MPPRSFWCGWKGGVVSLAPLSFHLTAAMSADEEKRESWFKLAEEGKALVAAAHGPRFVRDFGKWLRRSLVLHSGPGRG